MTAIGAITSARIQPVMSQPTRPSATPARSRRRVRRVGPRRRRARVDCSRWHGCRAQADDDAEEPEGDESTSECGNERGHGRAPSGWLARYAARSKPCWASRRYSSGRTSGSCDAAGVGAEHVRGRVAGLLLAGRQRDDLGDPPGPLSPAGRDLGLHAQLDDQVDGRCELARREPLGDVRARLHRAGDELADGGHGIGRVGRGDGSGAGLHRLDHRPDLLATDLADDLAREVEAEGVDERLVEGELARLAPVSTPLTGSRPGLPGV